MLFYEDLLKELTKETEKNLNLNKIERFGLDMRKKIVGYGIALPLIMIGLLQVYSYTIYHKWYWLVLGIIFFGLGLKQGKNIFTYSILINTENGAIISGKLNTNMNNIKTCALKETKLGKRVVPVIDMITNDKKQIIIPLYMNKKIRFIMLLKELLNERFSIIK